eukprot:9983186-Prorocentrum_lima.AAC.1
MGLPDWGRVVGVCICGRDEASPCSGIVGRGERSPDARAAPCSFFVSAGWQRALPLGSNCWAGAAVCAVVVQGVPSFDAASSS